jgi:N-acetylglucosamine-6-phosphate deacetylase
MHGDVAVAGSRISALEPGGPSGDMRGTSGPLLVESPTGAPEVDAGGCWVFPGFVDLHVHGGNGANFALGSAEAHRTAAAFHARHGTTALLATTMAAPLEQLRAVLEVTEKEMRAPSPGCARIVGCHLEGPYLSPERAGAQPLEHLRPATLSEPDGLLEAAVGIAKLVTLAPELDGGTDLVQAVVARGMVAALGHSNASFDQAIAAFAAGARHVTHLCNGMRPLHHREPGLVGAALERDDVNCEVIADGHHLHPATLRMIQASAAGRLVLVTDATPAAGLPDGDYSLGDRSIRKRGERVELAGGSVLAGSALTMDRALRNAMEVLKLDPWEAAEMVSALPARVVGMDAEIGSLEVGKAADLVVLDSDYQVIAAMVAGRWVEEGRPTRPV